MAFSRFKLFQFLIGRLRTVQGQVLIDYLIVFQFLIGRLRTYDDIRLLFSF